MKNLTKNISDEEFERRIQRAFRELKIEINKKIAEVKCKSWRDLTSAHWSNIDKNLDKSQN